MKGTLRRESASTVDQFGDPVVDSFTDYPFEGIRDTFNRRFAVQAGIPITDVKILIIGGLINVVPQIDDKIHIRDSTGASKWHQVRTILVVDPANAHYELQAFEIKDPVEP